MLHFSFEKAWALFFFAASVTLYKCIILYLNIKTTNIELQKLEQHITISMVNCKCNVHVQDCKLLVRCQVCNPDVLGSFLGLSTVSLMGLHQFGPSQYWPWPVWPQWYWSQSVHICHKRQKALALYHGSQPGQCQSHVCYNEWSREQNNYTKLTLRQLSTT